MTEEKFMRGVYRYRSLKGEVTPSQEWLEYLCHRENLDLRLLVVNKKISVKEIRKAWRIKESPLGKALR